MNRPSIVGLIRIVIPLLLAGCATTQPVAEPHGTTIIDVTSGELLAKNQVLASLQKSRHIYVGEHHTSAPHHAVQLDVLRSLHDAGVDVAIGIEWLPASVQPAIDDWLSHRSDDAEFLSAVDWTNNWGHTFEAYAAIFRFARRASIPVWGLNAPPGLARAVGRMGPERLGDDQRAQLPPLDSANDAHRRFFKALMAVHHGSHGKHGDHRRLPPQPNAREHHRTPRRHWLDRYYLAQLVRDEWMSINLKRHLDTPANSRRVAVVFAGLGHVDYGLGIPLRAKKLLGADFRIVLPIAPGRLKEHASILGETRYPQKRADFIWEAPMPSLQASTRDFFRP